MNAITRRRFLTLLGGSGAVLSTLGSLVSCSPAPKTSGKIIVIGGGFGGATCAKYLNIFDPTLSVTLIEASQRFTTCPFSNAVLGGMRNLDSISHGYHAHEKRGINVVHARGAAAVSTVAIGGIPV